MTRTGRTVYRVFPLAESLRGALRTAREARQTTNREFIADAVARNLAPLVERLVDLGLGRPREKVRPARLPFSREDETLTTLRAASEQLAGVPANLLLAVCLAVAVAEPLPEPKRRRGRRKADPVPSE